MLPNQQLTSQVGLSQLIKKDFKTQPTIPAEINPTPGGVVKPFARRESPESDTK